MQTFLPTSDFAESARLLDTKRLGKQRVECKQIWNALHQGGGWKNHPAVSMWRGHRFYFLTYYHAICAEWRRRGYRHEMTIQLDWYDIEKDADGGAPFWLGLDKFHTTHCRVLYEKDSGYYEPRFKAANLWIPPILIPRMLWPVRKDGTPTHEYAAFGPIHPSPVQCVYPQEPPLPAK